jgi:hypothetical protein
VLEGWAQCARERKDDALLERVGALMPKRVKKKRAIVAADGSDGGCVPRPACPSGAPSARSPHSAGADRRIAPPPRCPHIAFHGPPVRARLGCAHTRRATWLAALPARVPAAVRRWEEYYDYIYPDETASAPSLKILEMAHKWKRQRGADGDNE